MIKYLKKMMGLDARETDHGFGAPSHTLDPASFSWSVPDGVLVYAIGDIHGRLDLLLELLERIDDDRTTYWGVRETYVVFLGDYVDRGFQSREVLDFLTHYRPEGVTPIFLRGNHEDLMLQFMDDPMMGGMWLSVGGAAALASYGVDIHAPEIGGDVIAASDKFMRVFPPEHRQFLESLPVSWRMGDYFFVHAGIRPGLPPEVQDRFDMTTIRQDFTLSAEDHGVCVVHGHSGVPEAAHFGNRIALDTGAFATGVLSACALNGNDVRFISTT